MARSERPELLVSTDVEADGPLPGPSSLLSLGSVAYGSDGSELGTFEANLEPLPGASPDPATSAWWARHPEAHAAATRDPEPPERVLPRYAAWLEALPGRPVLVAYPGAYDFLFVHWYLVRFAGRDPFGHSALCLKTLAWCLGDRSFHGTTKATLPARLRPRAAHTHRALDDAREQGELLRRLLEERAARLRGGATG